MNIQKKIESIILNHTSKLTGDEMEHLARDIVTYLKPLFEKEMKKERERINKLTLKKWFKHTKLNLKK